MINAKELPEIASYIEANIEAGVLIAEIFEMTAHSYKKYAGEFSFVASELQAGRSLPDTLYDCELFEPIIIEQISAGESSGRLGEAFAAIAAISEQKNALSSKLKGSLMIPVVTIGITSIATLFMIGYIIPTLTAAFGSNTDGLFISLCNWLHEMIGDSYWVYGIYSILVFLVIYIIFTSESLARKVVNMTSGMKSLSNYHFGVWAAFMSMLQRSGVEIATAVPLCEGILPEKLAAAINRVFSDVTEMGLDYSLALNEMSFEEDDIRYLIPENIRIAIKLGGSTGRMDMALKKSSVRSINLFNKSVENIIDLTKIIIPFLVAIPVFMIVYMFFDVITQGFNAL